MALVIGTDSYTDLAYFTSNILEPNVKDVWDALTTAQKEQKIKYATRIIDDFGWIGYKVIPTTQLLAFPRSYTDYLTYDKYYDFRQEIQDYLTENNEEIPDDVKLACVKVVEDMIYMEDTEDLTKLQLANVDSFSAGSLNFKFKEITYKAYYEMLYPRVKEMIRRQGFLFYLSNKLWYNSTPIICERS